MALALASAPLPVPRRPLGAVRTVMRWRHSPAGVVVLGAQLVPDRVAAVDADAQLTYADLDRRTNAIARTWSARGIDERSTVGLLAQNGLGFLEAMFAAHKLGASLVFLNTSFAPPQVADVVASHDIDLLVHDRAMAAAASLAEAGHVVDDADLSTAARGDGSPLADAPGPNRVVVLTSGTTGRPKGAERTGGDPLAAAGVLTAIPIVSGDTIVVAAPMFHSLGLFAASIGLALRGRIVLDAEFDAERTLELVARHRAQVLVAVPVMLQRMLQLPGRVLDRYDTTSLRVVLCGGSQLSGALARAVLDRFGDVLYNVYGSTEVGLATVAGPRDLRDAPGTAGRAVPNVTVRILDGDGRIAPAGDSGRIFVGSRLRMDGYVGGGAKEAVRGLSATGDVGRLDISGRLFVEGRSDDMIVSGGENVFPAEVEEILAAHPAVVEAAVIGVPDVTFGQRLRAFVVRVDHATTSAEDLREHVRGRLARFKTPRDVIFVDALPRGSTGKILTRVLRDHPAPNDNHDQSL